jgi:hypothetical protein
MQTWKISTILLGMAISVPVLFGLAYLICTVDYRAALIVLFIGLASVVLGGLHILDKTLAMDKNI